jgi:hypothetical protein
LADEANYYSDLTQDLKMNMSNFWWPAREKSDFFVHAPYCNQADGCKVPEQNRPNHLAAAMAERSRVECEAK